MHVDTALALRVLAHELRSPTGVAHGYVRMLLDGRVPDTDRRRVLEQVRDVLARITELSRQASEAAHWTDRAATGAAGPVDGHAVVDAAFATVRRSLRLDATNDIAPGASTIRTIDSGALAGAVAALLDATLRERPGLSTKIIAALTPTRHIEVVAGASEVLSRLRSGPEGSGATPISVERGGLGLALVNAALVLDTHGAVAWTIDGQRSACGIRIPREV
jgi:hypothetical protein